MSSQFVDINADGYMDILVGSFEGVPFLIKGSKAGYGEPEQIKDVNGEIVLIEAFWNWEDKKWDSADRAKSKGHCTSVAAVDWDNDGDLDLLLGDYYGGRLFLRMNEGTAKEPSFAATNQVIEAGGKPLVINKGLAAPRVVDWDGDGLFDILCGGAKGGVYFFKNTGNQHAPKFAAARTLIAEVEDPTNSYVKRVPTKDGQPTLPGSSYHIEAVDFDGDGDLDLLIGGRSSWFTEPTKELTRAEQKRDEILAQSRTVTVRVLAARSQNLLSEKPRTGPTKSGDFIWLFRRK